MFILKVQRRAKSSHFCSSKFHQNQTKIVFGIMFWKHVALYDINSKKLQWPKTFCTSLYNFNVALLFLIKLTTLQSFEIILLVSSISNPQFSKFRIDQLFYGDFFPIPPFLYICRWWSIMNYVVLLIKKNIPPFSIITEGKFNRVCILLHCTEFSTKYKKRRT